ncbi:MAG: glutamine synthetase III [Defluviitaleaceae bacterium]|nr:glutamine synthetase III [Defluviitaleaceae bacterium]
MKDIPKLFGSMVFNDDVMRAHLPRDVYKALRKTMSQGTHLELDIANVVAAAMKNWAVERGATHYTHWFQPMTGVTAEKHDSFISNCGDGKAIMEFSGKELVKGEPDASSFPSGGLRCTFEARGYTIWDTTSYAFIKDGSLCIPTAFCAYSGETLDKKTPLLRSMQALNTQALRILKLFGKDSVRRVTATVGPEQEYFLVDRGLYEQRPDLVLTGRTLFGARPPKGQEMEDHYYGSLSTRVSAFMRDLDEELWTLGVYAKTKHNETAPAQHELALIYSTANIATDHNQLSMELLKSVAARHGLVCLLHEKPFANVNGSGKHNNWAISTDTGANLLEPGDTPHENAQFLLFLAAVIKAVDDYQGLLRAFSASAGNDHRLGGFEAPPAIISMFLGDELTAILEALESGEDYTYQEKPPMEIGATALPHFPKDSTDRNRTSPFAFTGNKFEFRMLGATFSIADPNTVLNTAVAESLRKFADELEAAPAFGTALDTLVKRTIGKHKRIIFNGNNYSAEWIAEAARRGLPNLRTSVEALPALLSPSGTDLFAKHGVFSEAELLSRYEILLEGYCKTVRIEGLTMSGITMSDIIPACIGYQSDLALLLQRKSDCGGIYSTTLESRLLSAISDLSADMLKKLDALDASLSASENIEDKHERARFCSETVLTAMADLRLTVDKLETVVAGKYWPLPSYARLFYSTR